MLMDKNSILVAMSGGVDSSVTAYLMKNAGYNVKSAILRMHDAGMSAEDLVNGKIPEAIWYAREASRKLRLDFSIIDVRENFDEIVKEYFISNYEKGFPLDPSFYTLKHLQLPQMFEAAEKMGCEKIATGHYAIIEYDEESKRYILKKSRDRSIDQSYKLYRLSQEELSKILTPLGEYTKDEVRKIAADVKLKNVRASEDLCFIPDGEYWEFVGKRLRELAENEKITDEILGLESGNFVDAEGNILGQHKGFLHYTVGKRTNLDEAGISQELFVCEKRASTNEILLTTEDKLYKDTVRAQFVNFVSLPDLGGDSMRVTAKIHYGQDEYPGTARILEDGCLEVKFDSPVKAPVPGLSMVIYDDDKVVAGGLII